MMKDLPSFSMETPVAIYHLHNNGHMQTLTKDLMSILALVWDIGEEKGIKNIFMGIVR